MKYRCVKQFDTTDCGSACIASIAWSFGKKISLSEVREFAETSKEGTSVANICQTVDRIGLKALAVKRNNEFKEVDLKIPCIAHVYQEDGFAHYIVLYKLKKNEIIISDPAIGVLSINKMDFLNGVYSKASPYVWSGIAIFIEKTDRFIKDKDKNLKRVNRFQELIWSEHIRILKIILFSMLSMVISILTSFYFGFLIDRIIPNKLKFTLLFMVLLMIGGTLLKVLIDWIRAKDVLKVSRNINLNLHLLYYKHILKLPMGILDVRKSGELLSRFQDVDKIQEALISSILVLPANLVLVFVVGGLLAYKNYVLFLIVLTMCLCYSLTIIGFSNCYMSLNALEMNDQARVMAHLVDSVEGIQTVKSYNYGEKIYTIGLQKISDWQNRLFRLGKSENCQEAIKAIINMLGEILILSIGAYEIMNGELSIGELVTYNVLVSYLLNPIKNMIGLQSIFHTAQVAMERLENVLDIEIEKENGLEIEKNTSLELKNVCFGFNSHLDVLKNINLKIDIGDKIAIVGKTGSGKTSLAKLLMRFYYPDKGNIVYGNLDYKEYGVKSIRDCVIYVSQEDFIFSSSIRENLKLGDLNISDSDMISISRELGVDEFVARMPRGYDSVLNERGANLSKGQRQRIALARAILKKPKVLILDEATSNMDYGSEKKIIRFLKSQKYLTVITITHRMSSITDSDYIYVMNSGSIVSCGVYDELLKTSLQFQELLYEEET